MTVSGTGPERVVLVYQLLGDYHRARVARAAERFASEGMELLALQIFSRQDAYRWAGSAAGGAVRGLGLATTGCDQIRWSDLGALLRGAGDLRPDAMFVNGWSTRDALALHAWCRTRGIPTILVSDSQASDFGRRPWKEWIKSRIVRRCGSAFVAGAPQQRYLERLGMRRQAIFNGCDVVDNRHFSGAVSRRRPGGRRLVTVARWEKQKNLVAAGNAFLRFAGRRPAAEPWQWNLAGYGSQEAELRALADRSGGRIRLLGYRAYADLPATYAEADIYWQPSRMEPWGLAVNEAMASGLPVLVSSRCGCAEDLVDAAVGWVFDPGAEGGLLDGLESAARCHSNWPGMGAAASARIADWDLDRFADGALAATRWALRHRASR